MYDSMNNYPGQDAGFLANYTIVSGVCIREASPDAPRISYNPKLTKPPEYGQEFLAKPDSVKAPSFSDQDFLDYAEKMQRAGRFIGKAKPDVVLVPMRGGVRPWQHLRIYCNIAVEQSCLFPFTDREKHSEETKGIIANALTDYHGRAHLSIVCLDEAEGGHGTTRLLTILEELHEFDRDAAWTVTLCLLVPQGCEHAEWKHAHEKRSKPNFHVHVNLIAVSNVIGKDMDGAMISPENFGRLQPVKMRIKGVDFLIETYEFPGFIDQKIAEATHYMLLSEPFSTVVDIQKWDGGGRQ